MLQTLPSLDPLQSEEAHCQPCLDLNGQGSGMIRLVWKFEPPKGAEFRSGNVTDTPVIGSVAVRGGALPALSAQVWKCIVSVGPMLIRILNTSTLVALCAIAG